MDTMGKCVFWRSIQRFIKLPINGQRLRHIRPNKGVMKILIMSFKKDMSSQSSDELSTPTGVTFSTNEKPFRKKVQNTEECR